MKRDNRQNSELHGLLSQFYKIAELEKDEQKEYKRQLVLQFSNNVTESSAGLTYDQAEELISFMKDNMPDMANGERMRRKLIAMAHRLSWQHADGTIDMERLNEWCRTSGYLKKPLNDYTVAELPKLVSAYTVMYKGEFSGVH